jgi:hypothetical protein
MRSVTVKMPVSSVAVLASDAGISVMMPNSSVEVIASDRAISVEMPPSSVSVLCDDNLASTFTTPTLTEWHANAIDNGSLGCTVYFTATTAGTACRVRFHLIDTETYKTAYSSPDQNTTHASTVTITGTGNRGKSYDLKWSWLSGNEGVVQELILADGVYIPASGEGDELSEG